jgi:hypothetical protein
MVVLTLKYIIKWIGFTFCLEEKGLVVKHDVLLFIYVDNILVMSRPKQTYGILEDVLVSELEIKDRGKPKDILNVRWSLRRFLFSV